jgi:signal peptidase II
MRRLFWLLLPASVLAADLGSKAWILRNLSEGESLPVIKGFFSLTLGFNRGAIFGSLTWLPATARYILFAVAGAAALIYFGRLFLARDTSTWERVAFGLILGGALGNGIDRILRGAVVDFLDVYIRRLDFLFIHVQDWHYWTFNLADSFILVGAILYGLRTLMGPKAQAQTKENRP